MVLELCDKRFRPDFLLVPPPELLPVLGPLEQYMMPTLDAALLCSPMVGSDLGHMSDWLRSLIMRLSQSLSATLGSIL